MIKRKEAYPLPKPGTYPKGAGRPIKFLFFLSTRACTAVMLHNERQNKAK